MQIKQPVEVKEVEPTRTLMRTLARELTSEELGTIAGGSTSSKNCEPDDCDAIM